MMKQNLIVGGYYCYNNHISYFRRYGTTASRAHADLIKVGLQRDFFVSDSNRIFSHTVPVAPEGGSLFTDRTIDPKAAGFYKNQHVYH